MRVQLIISQFCIVLGKKKERNDQASKIHDEARIRYIQDLFLFLLSFELNR